MSHDPGPQDPDWIIDVPADELAADIIALRQPGTLPVGEDPFAGDPEPPPDEEPRQPRGRQPLTPVDLGPVLRGDPPEHKPTILARTDGRCLIYPGLITEVHGEPSHGKTWFALIACAEQLQCGYAVIYVDGETDRWTVVERLKLLGVPDELIEHRFIYFEVGTALTADDLADIRATRAANDARVVVYDTVTVFLQRANLRENDPEVLRWLEPACKPLARDGAAVIPLDHVPKDRETRGRWARGSGAKLGLYDASYGIEASPPFSADTGGAVTLTIAKDRYGALGRQGDIAAKIHIENEGGHLVTDIAPARPDSDPWHGPTECIAAIVDLLTKLAPAELTANQIEERLRELGKGYRRSTILTAASQAVADRTLTARPGPRKSFLYRITGDTLSDETEVF